MEDNLFELQDSVLKGAKYDLTLILGWSPPWRKHWVLCIIASVWHDGSSNTEVFRTEYLVEDMYQLEQQ